MSRKLHYFTGLMIILNTTLKASGKFSSSIIDINFFPYFADATYGRNLEMAKLWKWQLIHTV